MCIETVSDIRRNGVSAFASPVQPGINNFNPASMPRAATALQNVASGTGDAIISFIGDSTTFGAWSAGGDTATENAKANAVPALLARALKPFIPTSIDSQGGDYGTNNAAIFATIDPTIVTSTWVPAPGATAGGFMLACKVPDGTMVITPTEPWDTLELYTVASAPELGLYLGNLEVQGEGISVTSIQGYQGTIQNVVKTIITKPTVGLSSVTLTAKLNSSLVGMSNEEWVYAPGWLFKNSAKPAAHFVNLGIRAADLGVGNVSPLGWNRVAIGQPYVMRNSIQGMWKPHLSFINLGINDFRSGGRNPTVAQFKIDYQAIIDQCLISGDVVLVVPNDIVTEGPIDSSLYVKAIIELAKSNNLPWINIRTLQDSMLGFLADNLHPSKAGYFRVAEAMAPLIMSLTQCDSFDKKKIVSGAAYTLSVRDHNRSIELTHSSQISLTLPTNLPEGFACLITQGGDGKVSLTAAPPGVSIRNRSGHTMTAGKWAQISVEVRSNSNGSSAEYLISGDTA